MYSGFFCEIFLSADIYRLCKLGIFDKRSALLVGSRDQRIQFWKGAIQESFQQNLVDIGSVVSEEKIF
jgi:hypothetical protein